MPTNATKYPRPGLEYGPIDPEKVNYDPIAHPQQLYRHILKLEPTLGQEPEKHFVSHYFFINYDIMLGKRFLDLRVWFLEILYMLFLLTILLTRLRLH